MGGQWTSDNQTDQRRSVWTFSGGYDSSMPAIFLGSDKTADEFGWSTKGHPGLQSDKGLVLLGPRTDGTEIGRGLFIFQSSVLMRVVGVRVEIWNDGTGLWEIYGASPISGIKMADATNFEVDGQPKIIFVDGGSVPIYNGGSLDEAPDGCEFIVNDTVRVWLGKGDMLFFSARLDAKDWMTPNNSGFIQVYTPNGGDITGLYRYRGRTVVFKRDYMAEVPGKAYPTSLDDISTQVGCVSNRTIQEHDGILYFLGDRQVYTYQGGLPTAIGDPLREHLDKLDIFNEGWSHASITRDGEYMLSLVLDAVLGIFVQAVYNPKLGIWRIKRTGLNITWGVYSINLRGQQYIQDLRGNVYRVDGDQYNDVVPGQGMTSVVVSPPFSEGLPEAEKEYYEIHVQGNIPPGSTVNVMVSTDAEGPNFTSVGFIQGSVNSSSTPQIIPLDSVPYSHWFRVRLVATGPVSIYWVELYYNLLPVQH